ncbi:MAG: GDP-mannose 4,6-dehydratase [Chloroflexi bacterium]|nr:GDP-mannose 4,6-dehydratase [Chloroflexota bacterium]
MNVLVTGAAGFIGSHVIARLLQRGDTVIGVDNLNDYYSPNRKRRNLAQALLNPRFRLHEIDIRDRRAMESLFAREPISKVIHLAAMAGVRASILNPAVYKEVNVDATAGLLDLASRHDIANFVFASSSSVYGEAARLPFFEDDPDIVPASPYAATKRASEQLCFDCHRLYGLRCTCLRYFTVYGPRGRPDMAPYLFVQAILEGSELTMFGQGDSARDYTYVDDVVDGTIAALDADLPFEIINLGNSRPVTLRHFIQLIEHFSRQSAIIRRAPVQRGDIPITCADITKAKRLLGYSPKVEIEEGLQRFVDWYHTDVVGQGEISISQAPLAVGDSRELVGTVEG